MQHLRTIVLAVATALTLSVCAAASAETQPTTSNISAALRQLVDTSDPDTQLGVMAFGSDLDSAVAAVGAGVRDKLAQFGGESLTVRAGDVAALAADPGVAYLTTDPTMTSTGSVGPSAASLVTTFPKVDGADTAWGRGLTGAGVATVVIDSGVSRIADLGSRVVQVALPGQAPTSLDDGYGHGTFVAGVAAGNSQDGRHIGVAPSSTVYAINVSRPDGVRSSDVIAALFWVLQNAKSKHIGVVNLSLSESMPGSYRTSPLDSVVELLWRTGVVVVASAGNRGEDSVSYAPGNDPFVITAGALDTADTLRTQDDEVASFSSRGTTADGFAKPELVAPGRHIVAPVPAGSILDGDAPLANHVEPGYLMMNGTSFSAPQITAAVAVLRQQHPTWTPDQLKWVLVQTARSVPGARALDLAAATAFSGTPSAANVGVPAASTYNSSGQAPAPLPDEPCSDAVACGRAADAEQRAADFESLGRWQQAAARWWDASNALDDAGEPIHALIDGDHQAAALTSLAIASGTQHRAKGDWQAAAQRWVLDAAAWDRAAAWDHAAAAWAQAGTAYDRAAAWDQGRAAWAASAADYERAAAWDYAAAAWDHSGCDAFQTGDTLDAAAAWNQGGADWARAAAWDAAAWDKAAADWQRAAAWDMTPVWDRAAAWDAAAAWNRAAAWDGAFGW